MPLNGQPDYNSDPTDSPHSPQNFDSTHYTAHRPSRAPAPNPRALSPDDVSPETISDQKYPLRSSQSYHNFHKRRSRLDEEEHDYSRRRHHHDEYAHNSSNDDDSVSSEYSSDDDRNYRRGRVLGDDDDGDDIDDDDEDDDDNDHDDDDDRDYDSDRRMEPLASGHSSTGQRHSDVQPIAARTSSHHLPRRPSMSFREAARTAKDKLNRRWSFHFRPNAQQSSDSANQRPRKGATSSQKRPYVSPDRVLPHERPTDFLAQGYTNPLLATTVDPIHLSAHPTLPQVDAIDIPVKTWVLQGNGTAPRKNSRLSALSKKLGPSKMVRVESNPSGLAPVVLYASDQVLTSTRVEPFKCTESITSRPEYVEKQSIVFRDSPFEIGVVGMSISSQDMKSGYPDFNNLLMYSTQREPGDPGDDDDALPYIHYDPTRDEKQRHVEFDHFLPVPASRSLFMASDGGHDAAFRKSINCRFKVLELDTVDEWTQLSLSGVEQLGHHVQQYASTPGLGLLAPAMSLVGMVSKRALEAQTKPDNAIMIDMNFLLADRRGPEVSPDDGITELPFENRSGEYLRYGYYFFLERGVEAKLYASFRTFPNVSLMMKRVDKPGPNERQFFPLTGVSYVVIRVTPRISSLKATRKPIRLSHVQRLEELMKLSLRSRELCERDEKTISKQLGMLAEELGIARRPGVVANDEQKRETEEVERVSLRRVGSSRSSGEPTVRFMDEVMSKEIGYTQGSGRGSQTEKMLRVSSGVEMEDGDLIEPEAGPGLYGMGKGLLSGGVGGKHSVGEQSSTVSMEAEVLGSTEGVRGVLR